MKYFATATRPAKFEDGKFKFRKNTIFEVTADKALQMYHQYALQVDESADEIYAQGRSIRCNNNSILLYGLEIDDKELFTRRLKGEVAAEILE